MNFKDELKDCWPSQLPAKVPHASEGRNGDENLKKNYVEIIAGNFFFKEKRCLILKYCLADGFKM